jgi:hypothetical protein
MKAVSAVHNLDREAEGGPREAVPPLTVTRESHWRDHDLMIRRFHNAGLAPAEIAVVLNSKGLKVKTWHVSETFVRNRLKALDLPPNRSRTFYQQGENRYRPR